jgi:hypothetical protein
LTSDDRLERRYQWLLRCYPAPHRERHQDEMLGVLLADAGPGQRSPRPAESASLIIGGLRVRLRTWSPGSAQSWRDTLAVASVIIPVLVATVALVAWGVSTWSAFSSVSVLVQSVASEMGQGPLPALILAGAVLAGGRRVAAITVVLLAAAEIAVLATHAYYPYIGPGDAMILAVLGVEAVALAASAGPARGRAELRGRHYLMTIAAGVTIGASTTLGWWVRNRSGEPALTQLQETLVLAAVITGLAVAMLARSGASRRLLAVLALPGYYFVVNHVMPTLGPLRTTLTILPAALLLAAATLLLARRGGQARRQASSS